MKKYLLFLSLLMLLSKSIMAQNDLPERKYNNRFSFKSLSSELDSKSGYILAYHTSSFTNYNYAANIQSGDLKETGGFEFSARKHLLTPIFIDLGGFYDIYKVKGQNGSYGSNFSYSHGGLKLSFSSYLAPLPKILLPYAGIGYQLSVISESNNESTSPTADTSTAFWKAGIQSFLSKHFFLNAEYNQTLSNSKKSANQLSIGLGLKFK